MNQQQISLKEFYEQVGEHYPEEEQVYRTLRGILRKRFIDSWLKSIDGALLEIGTNRGMYLQLYDRGPRFGVDLSKSVLLQADRSKPVHLAVADAERMQAFKPGVVRHVLCSEVLEHCLHADRVFQSIHHVLESGGTALITTPNYKRHRPQWIELGVLKHFGISSECEDGYFHTAYRPKELEKLARNAGLAVVKSGTLEKEVKYAAKAPAALLLLGRMINRLFRSERLDKWNEHLFHHLTLWIYYAGHYSGLDKLLLPFIKEGVRSYILLKK